MNVEIGPIFFGMGMVATGLGLGPAHPRSVSLWVD
jgi:hypothetical protein